MKESGQFGVEHALMIATAIDTNDLKPDLLVIGGMKKMDKWLLPVLIIVAYFVLMRWVLPRLGIQT
jgi:hypothetical protein